MSLRTYRRSRLSTYPLTHWRLWFRGEFSKFEFSRLIEVIKKSVVSPGLSDLIEWWFLLTSAWWSGGWTKWSSNRWVSLWGKVCGEAVRTLPSVCRRQGPWKSTWRRRPSNPDVHPGWGRLHTGSWDCRRWNWRRLLGVTPGTCTSRLSPVRKARTSFYFWNVFYLKIISFPLRRMVEKPLSWAPIEPAGDLIRAQKYRILTKFRGTWR